jgi:hypothetical protein
MTMKVFVAKKFVHRFIENKWKSKKEDEFSKELNWYIVNLSHRICKRHSKIGHDKRQNIRVILWKYARNDIKQYQPTWKLRKLSFLDKIRLFVKRIFS